MARSVEVSAQGLFDVAGASAAAEVADAAAAQRDIAAALRRAYVRERNYEAAAVSETQTAAMLQPLAEQVRRILHDRRWPGSSRADVDHVVVWHGGVAVLDTKNWSQPVQVRDGRLWCGDDDRHDDAVDTLRRLCTAVEELLEEVATSSPGRSLGLSPLHVVPVLVFTRAPARPRAGPVRRTRPAHDAHRPPEPAGAPPPLPRRRADRARRGVPGAGDAARRRTGPVPQRRHRVVGVPIRARPEPPPLPAPRDDPDPLFDVTELTGHLTTAAAQPIHDWVGFLHPAQARLVRRTFNGPARVRGPAGTGKTVVLLHRAAWLATVSTGRFLVTSFVHTLPTQLAATYRRLSPGTAADVDFLAVHALARQLLERNGQHLPVHHGRVSRAFELAWAATGATGVLADLAPQRYWRDEIDHVIKGRGLRELADYEAVDRRGRTIPLTDTHKQAVWRLLSAYQEQLDRAGTYDTNDVLSAALDVVTRQPPDPGWSAVLVDEVQDLNMLGIRLCRELAGDSTDALFLVGDGQQALYPGGYTLAEARISVTGRAVVLRTNYRNTRRIIDSARELVAHRSFTDLDTTAEPGDQEVEVLRDGEPVRHAAAPTPRGLALLLRQTLRADARAGIRTGDMAVLCHTHRELEYVTGRLTELDVPLTPLAGWTGTPADNVKIGTIHRAKGLDFAAVYLPSLTRPRTGPGTDRTDGTDWELLHAQREYVARTRPRDLLWIGRVETAAQRARTADG